MEPVTPHHHSSRRVALALLALFFILLYGRYVAGFAPSGGDIVNQYLPYQELVRGALRHGALPYWNALTFCGRPLMADIQVGVLYPPNWLHWVLPLPLGFALLLAAHGAWMIAGCWRLGRHWRLEPAAIALGTVLYCACPFFTLKASQGIVLFIYAGSWWPWLALAAARLVERPSFGRLALAALAMAMSLLAGSPQITYYGWLAVCALALALVVPVRTAKLTLLWVGVVFLVTLVHFRFDLNALIKAPPFLLYRWVVMFIAGLPGILWLKDREGVRRTTKCMAWLGGAFALALGLTAIQTAQTASFIGTSFERGGAGADWNYVVNGSLAPRLFWLLAHPGILGVGHSEGALYFGTMLDFAEACFYLPLWVPALLLPLGVAAWRMCGRDADAISLRRLLLLGAAAIVLGIALAPGESSPLFALFYRIFPGFNRFRVPARLMILASAGEALVATVTLHVLLRGGARRGEDGRDAGVILESAICNPQSAIVRLALLAGALAALALVWAPYLMRADFWSAMGSHIQGFFVVHGRVQNAEQFNRASLNALLLGLAVSTGVLFALAGLWALVSGARGRWLAWLFPALAAVELIALAVPFQKSIYFTKYEKECYPRTELVQTLQREHRGGRVLWLDNINSWLVDQNQPEIYPNRMVMYGLPEARGYDPVNAHWMGQFMNLLGGRNPDENPGGFMFVPQVAMPAWLGLAAVETVVSYSDLAGVPGLRPVWESKGFKDDWKRDVTLKVWRNDRFLGMAFPAPMPKVARGEVEALALSARLAANPATTATQAIVVEQELFGEGAPALAPAVDARFQVKPLGDEPNRFRYEVNFPAPALLCLAQSHYGGWLATVDGDQVPLASASGVFMSTVVPKGKHEVVFDYLPEGLAMGRVISLAALVVLLYGLARARWMKRKREA